MLEDFTAYTEVDPNSHIAKTANHIDFQAYRNEDAYVYADKGVDHFGTSWWEHKIDGKMVSAQNRAVGIIWMLANAVNDYSGLAAGNNNLLALLMDRSATGVYRIYLVEWYGGTGYYSTFWTCSVNTPYYFTLKRSGTAFTCKIYSDAARTTLLTTLSIALQAGQPSHRYIFAANTYNDAETYNGDYDIDNLDLQEAEAGTIPEDARYRTKDYLEDNINTANLTKDNGTTQVTFIVAYSDPDYPLIRVFNDKAVDLVFCIGDPESDATIDFDHYPIGYKEAVPITVWCVDKPGITGTKLKWKAEAELRRVCEEYPEGIGSLRSLERIRDNDKNLGSTILHSREFIMRYERDTT